MSARSASRCELTETYSPTAIDIAPATSPAIPAIRMAPWEAEDARTPIMRLAVDTMASFDPSTAARNQPARPLWCFSPSWRLCRFAPWFDIADAVLCTRLHLSTALCADLLAACRRRHSV